MNPASRYSRQMLFPGIGSDGQERLGSATVAVVGLGALGTVTAGYLARAGVGTLRLIDRDLVELSNLQRQVLYTESDAREALPKAEAASLRLAAANSEIKIEARVADLTATNIDGLLAGVQLVVDGTDNFETRFLLNEWAVRQETPWIYGAAVGAYGITFPVLPGVTPCLACVFEAPPPPELSPTCDTAGILGPITGVVGALQAGEALKILAGRIADVSRALTVIDLWSGQLQRVELERREDRECAVCDGRTFARLQEREFTAAIRLCGRQTVQVPAAGGSRMDLDLLARRLEVVGEVVRNRFLVRFQAEGLELTVFADGRSLVRGTDDPATARSIVARYVGA